MDRELLCIMERLANSRINWTEHVDGMEEGRQQKTAKDKGMMT